MVSDDLKDKVEVVLFSAGKKININEVSKLVKEKDLKLIEKALEKLQKEYNDTKKSLMVVHEGEEWKLTVRERYLDVAKKIVADTELPKTIIETLAVIAWKQPVLQSEIIKVRTNKAYDHIKELERIGFLSSKKKSRTRELRLSEKFYKYFELSGDKDIRDMFSGIQGKAIDKAATYVEKKEKEKQESEQKAREESEKITKIGKLKVVDVEKKKTEELPEQTIGDLEVYDEPSESEEETLKKPEERTEEPGQEEPPSDESETEERTEEKLDAGEETTDIEPTEESTAETVPEGPVEAEFSDVTDETEEEKQEESEPEAEEPEKADEEKTEKKKSSEEEFNIDEVIDYHSK